MLSTRIPSKVLACAVLLTASTAYAGKKTEAAESLPSIAERKGFEAVNEAITEMRGEAKSETKLLEALTERGLQNLKMPVRPILGSELVVKNPGDLKNCKLKDKIYCSISVNDYVATNTKEHHFSCKSRFGTTLPLETAANRDRDGVMVWAVSGLEKCWEMGGIEILIQPISSMDLEGVGQGDEFMPPELVQLDYYQVQNVIDQHMNSFRVCTQNGEGSSSGGTGKLEVKFTIAEDGSVASAEAVQALQSDPEVVYCLLDRFKRIKFPPPRGGYTEGVYPFTLSN